jgi:hypothetical protein
MALVSRTKPILLGVACGAVAAGVSIAGNVRVADPHLVSTFPDLITLLVVPLAVLLTIVRMRATGLNQDALGEAGRRATIVAAVVFSASLGTFAWYRLGSFGLATYAAGTTFIAVLIVGFLVSLVCVRAGARAR